jgi:putative transcription factor
MNPPDIVLINPALRAKKLKEQAEKEKVFNTNCNTNNQCTFSGKKIKDDDELPVSDKVGIDTGKIIMQARLAKNLKQVDLAKQLNITPDVIRDYENGSAVRNGNMLNRIGKILGVKLTGK